MGLRGQTGSEILKWCTRNESIYVLGTGNKGSQHIYSKFSVFSFYCHMETMFWNVKEDTVDHSLYNTE